MVENDDLVERRVSDALHAARRVFEQDVESLLELTYPQGPVKERHLRQASVIVRRWLCDNDIRKLFPGRPPMVTVPVLDDEHWLARALQDPDIDYYLSAGVRFGRGVVWNLYHSKTDQAADWVHEMAAPEIKDEKLVRAMGRPMLYYGGEVFNLEEVLRFACNKLGGAHYDTSRNERQKKLDDAASFLTFGPPENTLSPGRVGHVHLELENEGAEVLSGVAVTVIVAATMLVNLSVDGERIVIINGGPTE